MDIHKSSRAAAILVKQTVPSYLEVYSCKVESKQIHTVHYVHYSEKNLTGVC